MTSWEYEEKDRKITRVWKFFVHASNGQCRVNNFVQAREARVSDGKNSSNRQQSYFLPWDNFHDPNKYVLVPSIPGCTCPILRRTISNWTWFVHCRAPIEHLESVIMARIIIIIQKRKRGWIRESRYQNEHNKMIKNDIEKVLFRFMVQYKYKYE